jgi:Fic family protein
MGAMMDLKLETVSREVTALVRSGVLQPIDKQGRHYRVLQPQHLESGG